MKTHLKEYTQNVGGRELKGTQTGRARFCPADSSNMHAPGRWRTSVTLRGHFCSARGKERLREAEPASASLIGCTL